MGPTANRSVLCAWLCSYLHQSGGTFLFGSGASFDPQRNTTVNALVTLSDLMHDHMTVYEIRKLVDRRLRQWLPEFLRLFRIILYRAI